MDYLIKRVKKFPIYDIFLSGGEGWVGWCRVSVVKNVIYHLAGRIVEPSELSQIKLEISKCQVPTNSKTSS